ncbi:MAG: hypothetical protein AB1598_03875 [Thermodesulfobacteriota bacterium]
MYREHIISEAVGLKNELKEFIESFQRKKMDFVILFEEKLLIMEKMKEIESDVAYDVSTESDGNGKKAYSNETLRNAELQKRLKINSEYWTLKVQYNHLEKQERFMRVEVELLEKKLRVLEQIVTLVRIESCLVNSSDGEVIHLENRM